MSIAIDAPKFLHLFDNFHGVFLNQSLVRKEFVFWFAPLQLSRSQNMGNSSHSMEQHSNELDQNNGKEKEHKDNTNGFQMQVLFCDNDLKKKIKPYD